MTKDSIEVKVKFGGTMAIALLLMCCFAIATHAAEINVPATVTAGSGLTYSNFRQRQRDAVRRRSGNCHQENGSARAGDSAQR